MGIFDPVTKCINARRLSLLGEIGLFACALSSVLHILLFGEGKVGHFSKLFQFAVCGGKGLVLTRAAA